MGHQGDIGPRPGVDVATWVPPASPAVSSSGEEGKVPELGMIASWRGRREKGEREEGGAQT